LPSWLRNFLVVAWFAALDWQCFLSTPHVLAAVTYVGDLRTILPLQLFGEGCRGYSLVPHHTFWHDGRRVGGCAL